MRLVADSGLWVAGHETEAPPLAAVLEVSGAVLSWTIDGPPEASQITLTDPSRADWMWRVLGEAGHVALASALQTADEPRTIELAGVDIVPGSVDPLRRLAVGHWLRRWWPASRQDGIAGLDRALLDVEVALLTAGAQGYFFDDTLDSDVVELLAPHAPALSTHVQGGDRRILDLVRAGAGLADEVGVDEAGWPELYAALDDSSMAAAAELAVPGGRRDDYALAAGAGDRTARRGTDRPGCRIHHLEFGPARNVRCGRGHHRLERRGGRCGGGRRRAVGRSSDRIRPPVSRCNCGPGPSAAAARWTPTAGRPSPSSTTNSGR